VSILDRMRGGAVDAMSDRVESLEEQLAGERATAEHLAESIAELEADNRGWLAIESLSQQLQFTRAGLGEIAATARLNWIANPLIRRAVNVRTYYTWGQGVEIAGRDTDVNEVVQQFLDDDLNQSVLFGHEAREEKDRSIQLDGNLFLACVTSPLTGSVQVRSFPWGEITRIISNPQDKADRWFYLREWNATTVDPVSGAIREQQQKQLYPAMGFRPQTRAKSLSAQGAPIEIAWDSPVLHVRTSVLDGMDFGISDVYAALAWARAYKGFLEDWASIAKALSRFAWKGKTRAGRASAMRAKIEEPGTVSGIRSAPGAGQAFVAGDDVSDITPVSKSGATLDADSGRPLAMMVAAAMDLPYTILMGDADLGNHATAKTLDRPTELAMQSRREMWAAVMRTLFDYQVLESVRAPQGQLKGSIRRDENGREFVVLTGEADKTVDITWPSILEHDVKQLVDAIVAADGTGHVPDDVICRLLLTALGVEDVDEIMAELVDADGVFHDPGLQAQVTAGVEAIRRYRNGEDPVTALQD
jgi:hypothetical protein